MMNRSDLMGIVAGCKTAEQRVQELCQRFGRDTYLAACQALLDRTYRAVQTSFSAISRLSPSPSRTILMMTDSATVRSK